MGYIIGDVLYPTKLTLNYHIQAYITMISSGLHGTVNSERGVGFWVLSVG